MMWLCVVLNEIGVLSMLCSVVMGVNVWLVNLVLLMCICGLYRCVSVVRIVRFVNVLFVCWLFFLFM